MSADPSGGGVAPPTIDVLPPWGTSGTLCLPARPTIAATSWVEEGESTATALPWNLPRQSVSHGSMSAGSVIADFAPKRLLTSSINLDWGSFTPRYLALARPHGKSDR